MMQNWNKTVGKEDLVIVAGDFMFGNKGNCGAILARLNGKKILVGGNHDPKETRCAPGWEETTNKMTFEHKKFTFKIQHFPWKSEETMENYNGDGNIIYCHGHTHNSTPQLDRHQINLSAEHWNYTPVHIDDIIDLWINHRVPF